MSAARQGSIQDQYQQLYSAVRECWALHRCMTALADEMQFPGMHVADERERQRAEAVWTTIDAIGRRLEAVTKAASDFESRLCRALPREVPR